MMEEAARKRFLEVHRRAAWDRQYQDLLRRCAELDIPLLKAMEQLTEGDRDIVRSYIRLIGSCGLRLAEIACEDG